MTDNAATFEHDAAGMRATQTFPDGTFLVVQLTSEGVISDAYTPDGTLIETEAEMYGDIFDRLSP